MTFNMTPILREPYKTAYSSCAVLKIETMSPKRLPTKSCVTDA
jgi:hypothetical protein